MATRPTRRVIGSGIASWDADVDDNFDHITNKPFAMFRAALVGDLPAASEYDDCLALVGASGSAELYKSDGSSWNKYLGTSANVADSTATTVSQMASDFNDLLSALQTAGIMEDS